MASSTTTSSNGSKKLRILLIPFFATSHIQPFTDLAICLAAAASPSVAVEATVAVTPANVSIVRSLLERHYGRHDAAADGTIPVKVAKYPFPTVEGLPRGVENLGKAAPADSWRIDVAAFNDALMRPAQEELIREQAPDALVTDTQFVWNVGIADELGVPCVTFKTSGAFPTLAMRHLALHDNADVVSADPDIAVVPRFPGPPVRIPRTELPEFLKKKQEVGDPRANTLYAAQAACFGLAVNTLLDLEQRYCELHMSEGYVKRAYFIGPVSLRPPSSPADASGGDSQRCIDWLDSRPNHSVVYVCFGSFAPVSEAQLHELALGLESSGQSFLWVVRSATWTPPEGWEERVRDRGMVVTGWAPQTLILGHPAVGAFVTHCGWNSLLETAAAGVPVLTWPMVFEQFINERLLTEILGIGLRLWPHGDGLRSTRHKENQLVPAQAVARAVTAFMCPGGPGDAARKKAMDLSAKAHAAMVEGGSSHRDLRRLVDDLVEARRAAAAGGTKSVHG